MILWDTSALVPLLAEEPTTGAAVRAYTEGIPVVWWATVVECGSSIARLERDGHFTATTGFATTRLVVAGIGPVLRDGRMLLVLQRPTATGPFETSLWSVVADPIRHDGTRRQLTPWREAGVVLTASGDNGETALSVSTAGTRLAFLRVVKHEDVYVASYDPRRGLLETPRRFTLDERDDRPSTWTPDGSAVFFSSVREDARDLFVQRLDSTVPEPVAVGPGDQAIARVTSDGKWLLFIDETLEASARALPPSVRIMRRPIAGGSTRPIFTLPGNDRGFCQCSFRGRCVLMQQHAGEVTVYEFDPESGPGRALTGIPEGSFGVTLLPDGNAIAYLVPADASGVRNRIRIVSFAGEEPRDILVRGALGLQSMWNLPGGGFVASDVTASGWSSGAAGLASRLVGIDPGGEAHEWWRPRGLDVGAAIPSPDGTHLAISVAPVHSDAWMIEGL